MAPPNDTNTIGKISVQQVEMANEPDRPSKRLKDTHVVSSAESSRATSPAVQENVALLTCLVQIFGDIPDSLSTCTGDISAFRNLWTSHGFRTSLVTSPHEAVSIFLDSCKQSEEKSDEGRTYLLSCIGRHPQQKSMETIYSSIRSAYCFYLFLERMRAVRKQHFDTDGICDILMSWETELKDIAMELKDASHPNFNRLKSLAESSPRVLSELITKLTQIDHTLRTDQLLREYNRITYENCTLTNACLQKLLYSGAQPKFQLDEVHFQCSPMGSYIPSRERITIRMNNENAHAGSGRLVLMPSLANILLREDIHRHPLDGVVEDMLSTTWDDLLRNGYYVDQKKKEQLSEPLKKFYLSGLLGGRESNMPIILNAHFTPTYPLSLYLWGTAGAGKSSLVRNLFPALNSAINEHCDPELMVRFVKQNLNKPFETLKLELDLRPNNNDYSVMSIIQGRRMTLSQSKPGLVLVALEEMPSNTEGVDPNQFDVSKLVSMRFSGRKGEFKNGNAPRNSAKRGISGDSTIITIFTSNYDLDQPCLEALQRLEMFQNLRIVQMTSVGGKDRALFAKSYLTQRVNESLASWKGDVNLSLDVPLGEGDTRPLVRYLRMLSFYIQALVVKSKVVGHIDVSVSFNDATNTTNVTTSDGENMQLIGGSCGNIYATTPTVLDPRATDIVQVLQKRHPDLRCPSELCQVLDFYFAKTLAPAVVLSQNEQLIEDLVTLLSHSEGVKAILGIDPSSRKIMKSLYDSSDTPNLRDDIIDVVNGNVDALVAIQLVCNNADAQMQIREIIEDTPSMTAFSTERSALCKDGLFFGVYVNGLTEITPEIESRASLVI